MPIENLMLCCEGCGPLQGPKQPWFIRPRRRQPSGSHLANIFTPMRVYFHRRCSVTPVAATWQASRKSNSQEPARAAPFLARRPALCPALRPDCLRLVIYPLLSTGGNRRYGKRLHSDFRRRICTFAWQLTVPLPEGRRRPRPMLHWDCGPGNDTPTPMLRPLQRSSTQRGPLRKNGS